MKIFDYGRCGNATIPNNRVSVSPQKNAVIRKIVNGEKKALWETGFTGALMLTPMSLPSLVTIYIVTI
jgi:hypothetical protein